jgi:hypothetical protein
VIGVLERVSRRFRRPWLLLVIALALLSAVAAMIFWSFGYHIPVRAEMEPLATVSQDQGFEEHADLRLQAALRNYRESGEPSSGLVHLETAIAEILDRWPNTLVAVKANQTWVAATRRALDCQTCTASHEGALFEFVRRAFERPSVYFSDSVSFGSSYLVAAAVSQLRESNRASDAWRLCRDARWVSADLQSISQACGKAWEELGFHQKVWHALFDSGTLFDQESFEVSRHNASVAFRNLKYRFNPYSGKYLRQLALALHAAGEFGLVERLEAELLRLRISDARRLESKLAQLRGRSFAGTRFPSWEDRE